MLEKNVDNKLENNINFAKEITVPLDDRTVIVKKLGLIKYAELSAHLQELIGSIAEIMQMDMERIMKVDDENYKFDVGEFLAKLITRNVLQVITFLDICVDELDYDYIAEHVGLEEMILLVEAILRVNKIDKVISDAKKLLTRLPIQKPNQ